MNVKMKMRRINKTVVLASLCTFLAISLTTPVAAAKKRINIVGSFGVATFFFDDPLVDLGVEFQLLKGFYGRFLLTASLGGNNPYMDPYYGGGSGYYGTYYNPYTSLSGTSLLGVNAIAAYRHRVFKGVRLLWQAGVFFMYYHEYETQYYESYQMYGLVEKGATSLGTLGGGGVEFILSKKIDIVVAAVYQKLFKNELWDWENGKIRDNWLKFSLGINFRVK